MRVCKLILVRSRIGSATALCWTLFLLSGCGKSGETVGTTESLATNPSTATNQAPIIGGVPQRMIRVGVNYAFMPSASDPDFDPLTFSITNMPDWAIFDNSTGELSGVPFLGSEGTYNDVVISVNDGELSAALAPFSVTVEPTTAENMPPEINGTPPTSVIAGSIYSFMPNASDPDGDPLIFSVVNKPGWAGFDPNTGELSGTPQTSDEGQYTNIGITVSDGLTTSSLPAFAITVSTANNAPAISGSPGNTVDIGVNYAFTATASDPDGDALTFSIQSRPVWASFNSSTGSLTGTPSQGDIGVYNNIRITVTDGQLSTTLSAFGIEVTQPAPENRAPTISGSPGSTVDVGDTYVFTPTAADPDGDALTFSVQNKPAWASFRSSTGRLRGTPTEGDVGVYSDIRITVTDGQLSVSLPQFSINVSAVALGSVTLSWTPPTRNSDGSTLTDLTAYKFYYGLSEGNYPNAIRIDNPGIATYVVEDLAPNTYYFVVTAINRSGNESDVSNFAVKTVSP